MSMIFQCKFRILIMNGLSFAQVLKINRNILAGGECIENQKYIKLKIYFAQNASLFQICRTAAVKTVKYEKLLFILLFVTLSKICSLSLSFMPMIRIRKKLKLWKGRQLNLRMTDQYQWLNVYSIGPICLLMQNIQELELRLYIYQMQMITLFIILQIRYQTIFPYHYH